MPPLAKQRARLFTLNARCVKNTVTFARNCFKMGVLGNAAGGE